MATIMPCEGETCVRLYSKRVTSEFQPYSNVKPLPLTQESPHL